ncbi:protoporphyrinogen/coproporphyrinogen oxidase [Croceivirga thetidis]|uniref:FAD-dependent oxidoreductase n=1 Tax=Croceivirga thetidis TaxID=2721623 RepID=A0ABX1GMB1_9FLAO|nr:FAD-dependent oxidoreductase [Croceivirga thetidis]NKI31055.1 FAD-dependent oxidoreductase [Croceivirga thetidis]
MPEKAAQVIIIGAGISGLIAAKTLEEKGYSPVVLEASETVGGRVKTSSINGFKLDHGFQVLLTAYPMARKHLDYDALNLRYFRPGALLFSHKLRSFIGDPLRDITSFIPTITSVAASFSDKWKIFKLTSRLKRKSLKSIFAEPESTTAEYIENYGFSDVVTRNFLRPFFAGIFLEHQLKTSSRMFEFVFKMFAQGSAAIPNTGIGAISNQLKDQLNNTSFKFQHEVVQVQNGFVLLKSGERLKAEAIISTVPLTEDGKLDESLSWKSCENFYFEFNGGKLPVNLIGLLTEKDDLANNINIHQIEGQDDLISITVVKKHELTELELEQRLRYELETQCGIDLGKLIHKFNIKKALPNKSDISQVPKKIRQGDTIFLAGDYLANGSLNAAMASGEMAAGEVIKFLSN